MPGSARFYSTPQPLGGQLSQEASALSAVAWQIGRLDVFGIGPDLMLRHWWFDNGAWGSPETIGPQTLSAQGGLSAISLGHQLLDIFAISSDGNLLHWWYDHGWQNNEQPEILGSQMLAQSGLSAVSWGPGHIEVFGIGADGSLLRWIYDNGWRNANQPQNLGGQFLGGGLSAVSWGYGRMDVFGVDSGGTVQHIWSDENELGKWSIWHADPLGGQLLGDQSITSALSAVSWSSGRLDLFGIGPDSLLRHWWFDNGAWGNNAYPETILGSKLYGNALSATSWAPQRLDIFGVAPEGTIPYWWYDQTWGNNEQPLLVGDSYGMVRLPYAFTAITTGPGRIYVFAYGTDGTNIQLLYWQSF